MGKKQAFTYTAVCAGVYIVLAIAYLLLIDGLLDLFSTSFFFHLIVFITVLAIVVPVLTYFIVERLPFKVEDLKVPDGLETDLKKEVEVIKNVQ